VRARLRACRHRGQPFIYAYACNHRTLRPAYTYPWHQQVAVDIKFEPSRIGEVNDTLTITHPEGGEYVCKLVGMGSAPSRAGPVVIRANQTVQLSFTNVLAANVEFIYTCTPANLFTLAKPKETIPAKKASNIAVSYKPEAGKPATAEVRGQLTVVANAPASATGSDTPLRWVFYLRGDS
jgi:hypothetical protein